MELYIVVILILVFSLIGWLSSTGVKSQLVRVLDIFIYGPFLIWVSTRVEQDWIKIILVFLGATTIAYNLRNWLHKNRLDKFDVSVTHPASW